MDKKILLSRDEIRALDRLAIEEIGMPGAILMENAGRGTADYLVSLGAQGSIVICCGKGNNAGDGFVAARHLDNAGLSAHILLFCNACDLQGDAKLNYDIAVKSGLLITIVNDDNFNAICTPVLTKADWIVDALLGTGLSGVVRSPYDKVITMINSSAAKVLSIDIPSGLDCDTGEPLGIAVKAHYTATFISYKKGFVQPQAKSYLGDIRVIDIGIPKSFINKYAHQRRENFND